MNLIPVKAEQVVGFRDLLRERTGKNEIFPLGKPALNLSIDIIGKVVIDANSIAKEQKTAW